MLLHTITGNISGNTVENKSLTSLLLVAGGYALGAKRSVVLATDRDNFAASYRLEVQRIQIWT